MIGTVKLSKGRTRWDVYLDGNSEDKFYTVPHGEEPDIYDKPDEISWAMRALNEEKFHQDWVDFAEFLSKYLRTHKPWLALRARVRAYRNGVK